MNKLGTTSLFPLLALALAACSDGSGYAASGTSAASAGSGVAGTSGGSGSSTSGEPSASSGSVGGTGAIGSGSGSVTTSETGSASGANTSGSMSGSASTGSSSSGGGGSPEAGPTPDPYAGPFKILVLSKTLGFHHDSIPACQQMLRELGQCIDATSCAATNDTPITAAKVNSSFTVDVAGAPATGCPTIVSSGPNASDQGYAAYDTMGCDGSTTDLSQFSAANLDTSQFSSPTAPKGPYQMVFFCSPTGTDFTSGGANGMAGMTAIQNFITAGAGYGGVHAASDFEDTEMWQWYYNDLMGSWFKDHNNDGTPGTVNTVPMFATHPIMQGIPSPWNTQDEWYLQNREMNSQPGFQILATLSGVPPLTGEATDDIRPIIWIKQFPVANNPTFEGRSFYTVRGHNIVRYGEAAFRQLIHQGVLWAAHRLN